MVNCTLEQGDTVFQSQLKNEEGTLKKQNFQLTEGLQVLAYMRKKAFPGLYKREE